jgi:Cd2+/Zn2+-exporting ATPase
MQMDCPVEENLIRKKLGNMAAVKHLEFNLMQRILIVVHDPDALGSVLTAIRSLGFEPELPDSSNPQIAPATPAKSWWPLVLAGLFALSSEIADWLAFPEWSTAALSIFAVALSGISTYKKGWIAVRNGNMNINALMSVAVTGALLIGQWPEAAMVMVLFTISELIEAKSLDRARNAIEGLLKLVPETVTVSEQDGSWREVEASTVDIGRIVRVRPGERIGLDGKIIRGNSSVNQAPITGESLPVEKEVGDAVFAGTINQSGSFEYQVTAIASNTTLAKIIHAVGEAQGKKAPTQRFVDNFARIYTPTVFVLALLVAILPPLVVGGDWHNWIYKALVLLVIACPCALVISTPVSIVSGLTAAARHGILIKGGVYLEEGYKLSWLAFDKTGTITHGKPVQTDFEILSDIDAEYCLRLAVSLANRSDHPVSRAITAANTTQNTFIEVESFEAFAGRGVSGIIDGKKYVLGNHRLIHEQGLCSPEYERKIEALEQQGKTVVLLADEQQILAMFAVADTVKENSRMAIAELHRLGVKTVMLTGDNQHTANAIAQQVGIDLARGDLLPQDKLNAVESLGRECIVGMVGDGINDAPALACSHIGFAMGAMGTDTAIETADVALMDDDLNKIPVFVRLSRATHSVLIQNISMALVIKSTFLILTLAGLGSMWMAVFADVGASLLVVGNGLRLLRQ